MTHRHKNIDLSASSLLKAAYAAAQVPFFPLGTSSHVLTRALICTNGDRFFSNKLQSLTIGGVGGLGVGVKRLILNSEAAAK